MQFDPSVHQLVETPEVQALRRELSQGKDLVVYRHAKRKVFVLAHLRSNYLREYAILEGFPRISPSTMDTLRKQFNPDPRHRNALAKRAEEADSKLRKDQYESGQGVRNFYRWAGSLQKGTMKDHPMFKPLKLPSD